MIKLFMEGPFRSVASLENICPPDVRLELESDVVEFLEALHVLNSKDEVLAFVLNECDILPYCTEECLGWYDSQD